MAIGLLGGVATVTLRIARTTFVHPAAPSRDVDVSELKEIYGTELDRFQDAEGNIIPSYWCSTEASAVALTERRSDSDGCLGAESAAWNCMGNRVGDRGGAANRRTPPQGDTLTIRVNRVLNAIPRRIAMEWIFSEQNYVLGFVERTGSNPPPDELESTVRRHQEEIDRLERYSRPRRKQAARIWYFGGMVVGLFVVIALGALIPFVITPFGDIDLATTSMRRFYACLVAGGASVSSIGNNGP